MPLASSLCVLALVALATPTALATKIGTNLGGFLLIEEWMFSADLFHEVAEDAKIPQGVVLPPELPEGFNEKWFCEGDLVHKLVKTFGEERTIEIIQAHRETYITDEDIRLMVESGIQQVRVPVGWWAFIGESAAEEPVVIVDPAHSDRQFVTITNKFLATFIQRLTDAGLEVLIDIHAMPGGSAMGSYSGVFPSPPVFFKQESLMLKGFEIIELLCDFYLGLAPEVQVGVTGVTLMNEPAHLLQDDAETMKAWLANAIDIYRSRVVLRAAGMFFPKVFVNLIETSVSQEDMLEFMLTTFSEEELNNWAVLDVHHYFAWDGGAAGCDNAFLQNNTWACKYSCGDTATKSGSKQIKEIIRSKAEDSHTFLLKNGTVPMIACSEWSLATLFDSKNSCKSYHILDQMHKFQHKGFKQQGLYSQLFWTWKMPYGGSHEPGWSLRRFLSLGGSLDL